MTSFCVLLLLALQQPAPFPSTPLQYGFFTITFGSDGKLSIVGKEWPPMTGTWKVENDELVVETTGGPPRVPCTTSGRYKYRVEGARVMLTTVADACVPRQMVLRDSTWRPPGDAVPIGERKIVRSGPERPPKLSAAIGPALKRARAVGPCQVVRLVDFLMRAGVSDRRLATALRRDVVEHLCELPDRDVCPQHVRRVRVAA